MVVTIFIIAACQDSNSDSLSLKYEETQCANPWGEESEEGNYIVEVRAYLEDKGIEVLSIYIDVYDENAGENCNACTCPTGRNIVISVPVKDAKKAEDVGFVLMN